MSFFDRARDLVQRALGPSPEEGSLDEPAAPLPARPERSERADDFQDLLLGLGAEASEPGADDPLARKQREIAELQRNLELLRPLGEELASAEQKRLAERAALQSEIDALQERLAGLERPAPDRDRALLPADVRALGRLVAGLELAVGVALDPAAAEGHPGPREREETSEPADPERELPRLRARLEKRETSLARAEERLAMWRKRGEEMKVKASERWFELRDLRGRLGALERELKAERRTLRRLRRPVRELRKRFPDGSRPLDRLAELLGLEHDS